MTDKIKRRSVLGQRAKTQEFSAGYDYVMVFPLDGEKDVKPKKQSDAARGIVKLMTDAGLEVFSYLSVQDDEMLVLIKAPVRIIIFFVISDFYFVLTNSAQHFDGIC